MRCKILFLFLSFISFYTYGQNIQGKVTDDKTGVGIPFVSIGIVGTNMATITNESGEFVIKADQYPMKLRFSHVSYLLRNLDLNEYNPSLAVKLDPANISLNEVTIKPINAEVLLKSAFKKAKSYASQNSYGSAFYRQLTSIDDNPSEIYELFYDLKLNVKNVKGWLAKQTRFATAKQNVLFSVSNQSFLTFAFSGALLPEDEGKFINLTNFKEFDITIEKYIEQKDQNIAVIKCSLKNQTKKQLDAISTYYIGTEDLKIYRLDNSINNLPINFPGVILRFSPLLNTIATFANNNDGPVLESMSTKLNLVIKNGKQVYNMDINSLLSVYNIDPSLKNQKFKAIDGETKDKNVIESIAYDPIFWKNNPIVKQTSLEDSFIKMMESKQAFGTMINP